MTAVAARRRGRGSSRGARGVGKVPGITAAAQDKIAGTPAGLHDAIVAAVQAGMASVGSNLHTLNNDLRALVVNTSILLARQFNMEARMRNERIVRSGALGLTTPLSPLQKNTGGNGSSARWTALRHELAAVLGGDTPANALLTATFGHHDDASVTIALGSAPAFGPFAEDAAQLPTLAVLTHIDQQDLLLLRMHYADDFGINAEDAHCVATAKFVNWLQYY